MRKIGIKAHILLINPRLSSWSPNIWVPLGLTYIAAVLEQKGIHVEIIDLNAKQSEKSNLERMVENASIVGIGGMITEHQEILRLVNIVKKVNGEARVVLGGPLATTLPQELLRASRADFVVVGEGEQTIIDLIHAIQHGQSFTNIRGIAYKDGNQIAVTAPAVPITDLDTLPFPARHLLNMNHYLKNHFDSFGLTIKGLGEIRSTNLITSRGCPYNCTFCFKEMWGHKWRARSAQNILEEMVLLHQQYSVNGFFFNDDTFLLDRKRIFELCTLLKGKNLDIAWYCNGRVNLVTKELLKAMYNAGCRGIAYGIESGNQQILDSMKKNATTDQARRVVKWTKEAGINTTGYFMIGMLGETKATIRETMVFARELDLDYYGFSLTTPLAGTELYNSAIEAGFTPKGKTPLKDWNLYVNANLTQDCSDADLAAFENNAFREFYLKKRFGRHYFLTPNFWKEQTRLLLSLRNMEQAKALVNKARGIASSYWHKV